MPTLSNRQKILGNLSYRSVYRIQSTVYYSMTYLVISEQFDGSLTVFPVPAFFLWVIDNFEGFCFELEAMTMKLKVILPTARPDRLIISLLWMTEST
jgi:hypothetical protein